MASTPHHRSRRSWLAPWPLAAVTEPRAPQRRPRGRIPTRRLDCTVHVQADTLADLVAQLWAIGADLDSAQAEDRLFFGGSGSASWHVHSLVDPQQTAERYQAQLLAWSGNHPAAQARPTDHPAWADPEEPF